MDVSVCDGSSLCDNQLSTRFYLFQVMLWVLASLLTLVEYVFSEEDKESQHVSSQPSWSPSEDANAHAPWLQAAGKQTNKPTH